MFYTWYQDGIEQTWNADYYDYFFYEFVTTTTTFEIRVVVADGTLTGEATVTITVTPGVGTVADPTIDADRTPDDPTNGEYNDPITVTLATSTSGAIIYYTTDGANPTSLSSAYSGPFSLVPPLGQDWVQVKAFAVSPGLNDSYITTSGWYYFAVGAPVADKPAGTYELSDTAGLVVYLSSLTSDAVIYYIIDGYPDNTSALYDPSAGVLLPLNGTLRAIAESFLLADLGPSSTMSEAYTLRPVAVVVSPPGGVFNSAQQISLATSTAGAEIWYKDNGGYVYLSGGVPDSYAFQYDPPAPPVLTEATDFTAVAFVPGWALSTATDVVFDITTTGIDIALLQRLNIGNVFTTANFVDQHDVYFIITIATVGNYYLGLSDTEDGDGTDTVDVRLTLYESDQITVVPGVDQVDTGLYYSPLLLPLTVGDYYLKVAYDAYVSYVITGTAQVKIFQ